MPQIGLSPRNGLQAILEQPKLFCERRSSPFDRFMKHKRAFAITPDSQENVTMPSTASDASCNTLKLPEIKNSSRNMKISLLQANSVPASRMNTISITDESESRVD